MTTTRNEYMDGLKKQMEVIEAQRNLALYNLKLIEGASLGAWAELRQGMDEAWDRMRLAAAAATTCFEPLPVKAAPAKAAAAKRRK